MLFEVDKVEKVGCSADWQHLEAGDLWGERDGRMEGKRAAVRERWTFGGEKGGEGKSYG